MPNVLDRDYKTGFRYYLPGESWCHSIRKRSPRQGDFGNRECLHSGQSLPCKAELSVTSVPTLTLLNSFSLSRDGFTGMRHADG